MGDESDDAKKDGGGERDKIGRGSRSGREPASGHNYVARTPGNYQLRLTLSVRDSADTSLQPLIQTKSGACKVVSTI